MDSEKTSERGECYIHVVIFQTNLFMNSTVWRCEEAPETDAEQIYVCTYMVASLGSEGDEKEE